MTRISPRTVKPENWRLWMEAGEGWINHYGALVSWDGSGSGDGRKVGGSSDARAYGVSAGDGAGSGKAFSYQVPELHKIAWMLEGMTGP